MINLFSYGTLQKTEVQIVLFGRILTGQKDQILGYSLKFLEINDSGVLEKSNEKFHPILEFTGDPNHKIEGTLYEITSEEILKADEYEVDDYIRIETRFASGKVGFIYVKNISNNNSITKL